MVYQLRHNCGFCVAHSLDDVHEMIGYLQHRGRDAVGIACVGHDRIDVIKWAGEVDRFELKDLQNIFQGHKYHTYLGHVRYATRGRKDMILQDAHPHVVGGVMEEKGSHTIIWDCEAAIVHNGQINRRYLGCVDDSSLVSGCDSEAALHFFREKHEPYFLEHVPGAYSMAVADRDRKYVMVLRDPWGNRPACLGQKNGKVVVASEDHAIKSVKGGEFRMNLDPGSVYYISPEGAVSSKKIVLSQGRSHCFFEWNYLAHRDSIMDGVFVDLLRRNLGRRCAEEFPLKGANVKVTYVPRCPQSAAEGYADTLGLPLIHSFYKMRKTRAFQGPDSEERKNSIKHNLFLNSAYADEMRGSVLVILEDSTVRGTNSSWVAELVESAGVEHAILINYTPPIGIFGDDGVRRGCTEGVDMPPEPPVEEMFVARDEENGRNRTVEEISDIVGMEMRYLSENAMLEEFEAQGMSRENLCTKCIGGQDPFRKP